MISGRYQLVQTWDSQIHMIGNVVPSIWAEWSGYYWESQRELSEKLLDLHYGWWIEWRIDMGCMDKEVHWVTGAEVFLLLWWAFLFPKKWSLSLLRNCKYSTPFNIVHHCIYVYEFCWSCLNWLYQLIYTNFANQSYLCFDY